MANAAAAQRPIATAAVTSWGYQLQSLDLDVAAASAFDLLVIDPATDGSDDTALTADDLARLKVKPDGQPRLVLAYLSIGEAESYRSYWDDAWNAAAPDWLLGENPDWKENYAVCFWKPGWQSLMCGDPEARLDRIIAAGFDGVYLDKCDVVDDLQRSYAAAADTCPDLAGEMARFVAKLSAYAKAARPGFLVFMQNAEELLDRPSLRASLDGAAKEELVFGENGPEKPSPADDMAASRRLFDLMRRDGKLVLAVEYLNDPTKVAHARETLRSFGYVPFIARKNRKLDRLDPTV